MGDDVADDDENNLNLNFITLYRVHGIIYVKKHNYNIIKNKTKFNYI